MSRQTNCPRAQSHARVVYHVCTRFWGPTWVWYSNGRGRTAFNVARHRRPDKAAWHPYDYGADNDGARQLAYDLLVDALGNVELAHELTVAFVVEELVGWQREREHVISDDEIQGWAMSKGGMS